MMWAELALLVAFFALGLYAQFERHIGLDNPFHLNELHHIYWTAPLVLVGGIWPYVAFVIGYDDFGQHFYQCFNVSPLHGLFGLTLWRIPLVQRIDAWLDAKLGRKP